jgi:site-specific recombinase XerC
MPSKKQPESVGSSETLTIPELEQSKTAVLNTLASQHSRRSYEYAMERFIAWYCSEPRLTFNRSVVVKYRSFLERLSLSAATINLHLSAIRRLADESAESGWLSPEHAIGIRRVKGVKRLGRKMGNWLTQNQAQELVNAAPKDSLRGWRDAAMLGLLLGCGLRRSEVVGLNLDQLQSREGRWVIVNLVGKGKRLRTVPVPSWSKELLNAWLRHSGVSEGKVFRRVLKGGNATRSWRDSQRSLVRGEAVCPEGRHKQSGTSRSSPHLRAPVPWLWRRTGTDSVSPRSRFCADHRAVHRKQTEASRCGERSTWTFSRMRHRLKGFRRWPFRDVGDSVLYHAQIWMSGKRYPVIENALSSSATEPYATIWKRAKACWQ